MYLAFQALLLPSLRPWTRLPDSSLDLIVLKVGMNGIVQVKCSTQHLTAVSIQQAVVTG